MLNYLQQSNKIKTDCVIYLFITRSSRCFSRLLLQREILLPFYFLQETYERDLMSLHPRAVGEKSIRIEKARSEMFD